MVDCASKHKQDERVTSSQPEPLGTPQGFKASPSGVNHVWIS